MSTHLYKHCSSRPVSSYGR